MDIPYLLAFPFSPSIQVKIGPLPEDIISVDPEKLEERRDAIKDFCMSLPDTDGTSWQLLKEHTGGNGTMAKLLVALGELVGAWKMHPDPTRPEMWYPSSMLPMIQAGSVSKPVSSRMPKPSAGDLEKDTASCACCSRRMGPKDSRVHDLLTSREDSKLCVECGFEGCDTEGPCALGPVAEKPPMKQAAKDDEEPPDAAPPGAEVDNYLKYMR